MGHTHVDIFPSWVRLTVVGAAAAVTGKDSGEGEVTRRAPWMTRRRVAPGPFDVLALRPQVLHFLSDFVYSLLG